MLTEIPVKFAAHRITSVDYAGGQANVGINTPFIFHDIPQIDTFTVPI